MNIVWQSLFLLAMISCNSHHEGKEDKKEDKKENTSSLPACLQKQIDGLENNKVEYAPIQIDEYQYNGKRVFLHTADCCDQFNPLYDEDCRLICSPSGGIEGGGDHKCEDFSSTAKHVKLVWKKTVK